MTRRLGLIALVLGGVLVGPASAQGEQDPGEKKPPTLEELQRQIDELKAAQEETAQQKSAKIEELQQRVDELEAAEEKAPTTGGTGATMRLFGRIHLDYWTFPSTDRGINVLENDDPSDSPEDDLEFRRARIGVDGKIVENMLYKIELEFGHPDDFAFKDLYFGFENIPVVQTLLIGNQKRPYGLDHLNSSRYNVFAERPFFIEANNQDARRPGIAAYGVSEEEMWNWRYGLYDQYDWAQVGDIDTDRWQPEIAGRLATTYWYEDDGRDYAHAAVSGMVGWPNGSPGPDDTPNAARYRTRPEARSQSRWITTDRIGGAENNYLVSLEAVVNLDSLQLVGEYGHVWVTRDSGQSTLEFPGAYVYAAYFLTGEYMPWNRKRGVLGRPVPREGAGWVGAWQVAARYSWADDTDADIYGGRGKALTLGLNWYWNKHASLQINYIRGEIDSRAVDVGGQIYDGGDYHIIGARVRVDF